MYKPVCELSNMLYNKKGPGVASEASILPQMTLDSRNDAKFQLVSRAYPACRSTRAVQRYLLKVIENMDLRPPRAAA